MIQIMRKDLLQSDADIICHQVNCRNVMGAGVAKAIYTKWPIVKTKYHDFCKDFANPADLLGKIQIIPVNNEQRVINIFGQLNYGRSPGIIYTNYKALEEAFSKINNLYKGKIIAFPYKFGCGLAGGDWSTVETLMLDFLKDCDTIQICVR